MASALRLRIWDLYVLAPDKCVQHEFKQNEYLLRSIKIDVKTLLSLKLAQNKPVSLQSIFYSQGLGRESYFYYFKYPELCYEVEARFIHYKQKHRSFLELSDKLLEILFCYPPAHPDELSKRLRIAPKLMEGALPLLQLAIKSRFDSYYKFQDYSRLNRIFNKIRKIINENKSTILLFKQQIISDAEEEISEWEFWDLMKLSAALKD